MRLWIAILFLMLTASGDPPREVADVEAAGFLDPCAQLQPEHCFTRSPDRVLDELKAVGWFDCETCIDGALALYAERVQPLVDARCSSVTLARANLSDAIVQFDRAFQSVTDGNWFGHETSRHAAKVEWMLISISGDDHRAADAPRYTHDDIRALMLIWYRAHRFPDEAETQPSEAQFRALVESALGSMALAEQQMTSDRAAQLRQIVMRKLVAWL